jgi:putative NADPH-quinone reductase
MHALVILAHPIQGSFSHAIAMRACSGLEQGGHRVTFLDLYELGFRAAMTTEERRQYHGDQPIQDPMVAEHAALVKNADALVLVYPTWWSGQPAIMKGWFERVCVPGVGFSFDEHGKLQRGLPNLKRLVGISTYGSPWLYVKLINDNGRRLISRTLRINTGWFSRTKWLGFYSTDSSTLEDRERFLHKVEKAMVRL